MSDPLRIARQLRAAGSHAHLVFFAASTAAGNALKAELVRDPFVYPRFEIIDLPSNTHQLATRMGKVVSQVQRRLHDRRTSRRGRSRSRRLSTNSIGTAVPLLDHVLAHTRDAVLATDEQGRAVTWNEPAARLLGIRGEASPVTLSRPEHRELAALITSVLASGQTRETQIACVDEHGQQVQRLVSVAPIRDGLGTQHGTTVIARDESEYQRIQAALHEANRQKDEFLAIMSHELRTPLTSILGYTDMLLRGLSGPLGPMANKYVGNVRSAGDRLLELVNGLLDYTRLEAGVERLELRPVDLGRVVVQVVQMCQAAAQAKNIDLQLNVDQATDTTVEADEERISHVFRSMLGNALKFTPTGGSVNVSIETTRERPEGVRVRVSDSGVGMRAEQIGRVWERFYQGDASLTRPYGGMGLGLSIARHLVSLHGGDVGAESRGPGLGSTFWFRLPRRQAT
jgi:PAS domain S-box-containing protein